MASRKQKSSSASSSKKQRDEEQRENILQAVVLTDSYQTRFRPLTLETPRCLLPLANVLLIDYTLEFLSLAGVEDVFIFASTHAEKIEQYIRSSKWNMPSSPFKNCRIVMSPSSMSVGDVMRELDGKGMIDTDFLLVNGDFVSNLPLEGVLEAHRKRRTADKNAIMTMVLRQTGLSHRTKARGETGIFVIDEATKRCVHYEELRSTEEKRVLLPPELTKQHPQLRIRTDLIDCQVDICSPDVPALFTENFDYQHIRRHFLHGILQDYELYGKIIHTHIIDNGYAARVRSLQTYDAVSRDVISRWTYPLCPDSNLGPDQTFTLERGNIYKEEDVVLARGSYIQRNSVIGHDATIGEDTRISDSVIGAKSQIGKSVTVDGSYIWNSVTIGDGSKLQGCIIGDNAVIGQNCTVEPGAIISYGVKVADGTTVKSFSRMTNYQKKVDAGDHNGGIYSGDEYETTDSESEDEQASAAKDGLIYSIHHLNLSDSSISTLPDEESDSETDSFIISKTQRRARSDSATSVGSDDGDESWHKEASSSLFTAMEGDHPVEVASLELNGLRMTANASWHQVRRAIVSALLSRLDQVAARDSITITKASELVYSKWQALIKRAIHEPPDQVDFLLLLQRENVDKKNGESLLLNSVRQLYETDLVEEDGINKWWADARSSKGEEMVRVRKNVDAFIKWLAEAEEEGSEESEEESEDESEEEDSD